MISRSWMPFAGWCLAWALALSACHAPESGRVSDFSAVSASAGSAQPPANAATGPAKTGGYLGVVPGPDDSHMVVAQVQDGKPAQRAGIRPGDIILAIDNQPLSNVQEAIEILQNYNEGDAVIVALRRDGQTVEMTVVLAARPSMNSPDAYGLRALSRDDEGNAALTAQDYARRPMPPDRQPLHPDSLRAMAERSGTAIVWMHEVSAALERARRESKPVLWSFGKPIGDKSATLVDYKIPGSPTYEARDYDLYLRGTVFSYPSVCALVNARYVPLRAKIDAEQAKVLGVVPFDFIEPGFVVLRPDGSVEHVADRLSTFHEGFFFDMLSGILRRANGRYPLPPRIDWLRRETVGAAPELDLLMELGDRLLAAGEPAEAAAAFDRVCRLTTADKRKAMALARLARCARLTGDADAAWEFLRQAEAAARRSRFARADVLLETANMALWVNDTDMAATASRRLLEECGDRPQVPEALYVAGQAAWMQGREAEAQRLWKDLCGNYSEHPRAWCAAQFLSGDGAFIHNMEHAAAMPLPEGAAQPLRTTHAARDLGELPAMIERALDWLRRHQRSDGSWNDSPYTFMGAENRHNTYAAITALAGTALLQWQDVAPAGGDAVQAADAYLKDSRNLSRTAVEKSYAYAYWLLFLARQLQAGTVADVAEARAAMQSIIERMAEHQGEDGSWGHEYYNPFMTAVALLAMREAQRAGADVPQAMIDRGLALLLETRGEDGGYPYMQGMAEPLISGLGRSPLCELALYEFGRSSQEKLERVMDFFCEHKAILERVRQYDYHADQYRNGGFFFFHSFYPAAMAAMRVENAEKRTRYCESLLDTLCRIQELDGSWVDSANIGKAYGTAMALLMLDAMRPALDLPGPMSAALAPARDRFVNGRYADCAAALDALEAGPEGAVPSVQSEIAALRERMSEACARRLRQTERNFAEDPATAIAMAEAIVVRFAHEPRAREFQATLASWRADPRLAAFARQETAYQSLMAALSADMPNMSRELAATYDSRFADVIAICPGTRLARAARDVADELKESLRTPGFLGIMPDPEHAGPGLRIAQVIPGMPAEQGGLRDGDIILEIDGTPIANMMGFFQHMQGTQPGQAVAMRVRRSDAELPLLRILLGARPRE